MFSNVMKFPDSLLNRVSMYRLVIYYLGALLGIALVQSWRGTLGYSLTELVGTSLLAVGGCLAMNWLFAEVFRAPVNHDSALITGLILALIVGPAMSQGDYVFVAWAAVLAMASKYILAINHVHLFNPAAIAVVLTSTFAGESASWWIGTATMTPFVIIGGFLLVRKLRRTDLVATFLWSTFFVTLAWSAIDGQTITQALERGVFDSPLWFLAFVMLTEPVTLPATRNQQVGYAMLAGILAVPQVHIGSFYFTPELALIIASAVAIPFRSIQKRQFLLDRAMWSGPGLMDFLYIPTRKLAYQPGQYMEWTVDHDHVDSRGKRRYFTLASSPTERSLRIGVKFSEHGSSFKQAMARNALPGTRILAAQVAGDFTMPKDQTQKLAFIAGGIGVTPFRSMVKYLIDRRERRDVVMLYANRRYDEILYADVFQAAPSVFRFRPVYVLSEPESAPFAWSGERGRIDAEMIALQVPDYRDRLFYVSGSPALIQSVRQALRELGVKPDKIKTDSFAGLAG